MKKILISDFTIKEIPHGGSEWVNQVLIDKFNLEFIYSSNVTELNINNFYIISNISLMNPNIVKEIHNYNYIIIENDYKICDTRHPWRWVNSIIPHEYRRNYKLYENAKAVFVQTTDHLNVFKINDVKGNFKNLYCSIWSKEDLDLLETLNKEFSKKDELYAIYNTTNWIKNTQGSIDYCDKNNIDYRLIPNFEKRIDFLSELAKSKGLVFLPIARETFCRLVVEAKCMGLDVITTNNYGASLEGWFSMESNEMLDFLRNQTEKNLLKIGEYLN